MGGPAYPGVMRLVRQADADNDGAATYEPRLPPLEHWILRILTALVVLSMAAAGGSLLWHYLKSSTGFRSPWSSE